MSHVPGRQAYLTCMGVYVIAEAIEVKVDFSAAVLSRILLL
jgi:hypothetical protein